MGLSRPFALSESFSLGPWASYEYLHLTVDGYNEGDGPHALDMDDNSLDLHRVKLGLEGAWQDLDSGLLVSARAYYLGLYGDRDSEVDAFFTNDPASRINGFTSIGDTMDENNLGLGLNLELPLSENWSVGGGYNVLLGDTTTSQEGNISATFKF